ncbi:serine hydrolase domain-containing protein [Pseudoalteromonas sp. GB56]
MYKLILLILLFFSFNTIANDVTTQEELTATLESIRVENDIPSMSVAIITAGKLTYIKGFGFVDDERKVPTDSESLYRVASISKLFTAQAIMQLVDEDKIELNEKIGRYIPSFKGNNITIKELLTHSSGLSDLIEPVSFEEQRPINAYLDSVIKSLPTCIENKSFEYSDTNFNILGVLISTVSGVNYEQYLHTHILKPANMRRSGYFNRETAYFSDTKPTYKGKEIKITAQRPYDLSFNPSEGLISNADDLSKWLILTLENNPSLLERNTFKSMLEPQVKTSWGEIFIGLGWQVYRDSQENIARHPGSIRGYKSLILTYPDSKHAIILLSNSSDTPRWAIAQSITNILKRNEQW